MNNSPINSLYFRIKLLSLKKDNCIYYDSLNINKGSRVVFDLRNTAYIHYGDILFYLPAIIAISKTYNCIILSKQSNVDFISHFINNKITISVNYTKIISDIIITSPYSMFDDNNSNKIGLGLPTEYLTCKYPMFLFLKIMKILKINHSNKTYLNILDNIKYSERKKESAEWEYKSILTSPFIASGKFRDFFNFKRRKIIDIANHLSRDTDSNILLVGSDHEKSIHLETNNSFDYRGKSILSVMSIARNNNIYRAIGFDNFWMHYCNIIDKPYKPIFRGRFTKVQYTNHMNFINNSFLD